MYTLSSVFEMFPKWIALLLCIFITTFAVSSCLKKVQAGKKTVTVNGVKKIVTVKKIFATLKELYTSETTLAQKIVLTPLNNEFKFKIWKLIFVDFLQKFWRIF